MSQFIALYVASLIFISQLVLQTFHLRPVNHVYTHQPTQCATRSIIHQKVLAHNSYHPSIGQAPWVWSRAWREK